MLNKLQACLNHYKMVENGDQVICAVSGGADSMALLWAMYLLQESLGIRLSAVHFNHHLRGDESDADAAFVKDFCQGYEIPLYMGQQFVTAGKKGLEAAARDARYAYFDTLPGKIATAHTANDNAETVLMHLVRGTGLKGLGGIAPMRGNLIRPMLNITRQEVLDFLAEYSIPYRQDSSNETDAYLRNRLRHKVIPLLEAENPSLAENLSATAQRLRLDEQALEENMALTSNITDLRKQPPALRSRVLSKLLINWGVKEPEAQHIQLLEQLVFSPNPSATAYFPGDIRISRKYDVLEKLTHAEPLQTINLNCPGITQLPQANLRIICENAKSAVCDTNCFSVNTNGSLFVRCRLSGDRMRLSGGSKSLKVLFIDRKIPATERSRVPVICDDNGILGVYGIGPNRDRIDNPTITIRFEPM